MPSDLDPIKLSAHFTDHLVADTELNNVPRQVPKAHFSWVTPTKCSQPKLLLANESLAAELEIPSEFLHSQDFAQLMTGNALAPGSKPYAMCYGGHQFGQWAGQLGDGRAINLGEIKTGESYKTLQLKGAGRTPYSRTADGLAVLRSSIREYLCSEAMYHLGVPTTRALSLCLTGDQVLRDILYSGHAAFEPGAIVCRVSESFVRFGNFEILAVRGEKALLTQLLDFVIQNHYPEIQGEKDAYLRFFQSVSDRTRYLITHWQRIGFVHGVLNTDNMSILGQTIDYGPYGWIDQYDQNWTPNTTDLPGRRYRFGNQPIIGQWNLIRLANAIYPIIPDADAFNDIIHGYRSAYFRDYTQMMGEKIGLENDHPELEAIILELERLLQETGLDMTIFFQELTIRAGEKLEQLMEILGLASYQNLTEDQLNQWKAWFEKYQSAFIKQKTPAQLRILKMQTSNPRYVLRNYMAQMAIDKATEGDLSILKELNLLLQNPYTLQPALDHWYAKRPEWAENKVGCSMLSCSS